MVNPIGMAGMAVAELPLRVPPQTYTLVRLHLAVLLAAANLGPRLTGCFLTSINTAGLANHKLDRDIALRARG